MTTTPVLPSLPEPAMRAAPVGQEAWPFPRVGYYTAEQMNEHARRAIESLSRAPAEPVAWIQHWPGLPDRVFDMTVIDPRKTTWSSGITYTLLYAHPTESAGPAPAEIDTRHDWIARWNYWECHRCGMISQSGQEIACPVAIKLGESHEG
ncbi:hypothetical protein [Methylibium sp.]|uniref:hypothetical protein n=1 Tax=Methylibium sp. TaxID=2067992 RepID=UPI003D0E0E55